MLPDAPVATRDEYETEIDALRTQLMYHHALLAILLELNGGSVKIPKEVVDNYDLHTEMQMTLDDESLVWTIAIVEQDYVASDVTA